jgi:hypothetical protein
MSPAAFFALSDEWRRQERIKDGRTALVAFITARGLGMQDIQFDDLLPHNEEIEAESLDQINMRVKDVLSGLR